MENPLLSLSGLPPFSRIRPEHVEPAIDRLLAKNRGRTAELLDKTEGFSWRNLVQPLEVLDDRLSRAWAPVRHMNSVVDSDALRAAYNACVPKLSEYATEMGQNERLYRAYKEVLERADELQLDAAQRKLLENALRDFHLSGVDLPEDSKRRFKEVSRELSRLASRYEQNLLDATQAWTRTVVEAAELAGLPESALALARQTAQQRNQSGWLLTLEFPSYHAVMTYAHDRDLRREVYEAYATRASDRGPYAGKWDNSEVMEQILALRHEAAQLLGYANYAERSLVTKMARSPDQVMAFLEDLARRSHAQAQRELEELQQFARQYHGRQELAAWDIGYYAEKLREQRYNVSQEELKPYFPAPRVTAGLFAVAERLFGIRITPVEGVDTWHPDVTFFEIRDRTGVLRGQFYLDLYARPHKRGGAWMDDCIDRMFTESCDQIPVAFLTCNFSPPLADRPALLTHDDVQTLFHEFGHGLHHLLTRIDYPAVAGINGVAWDAVELPSQFMENWCWEKQALDLISGHFESGEPLPDELFRPMLAARNFQSAMQMVRQLEFAIFDFRLHRQYAPQQGGRIYQILDEVRERVAVVRPPEFNRFAHGFSHIFAGGYAAGYYSYKWAEVLSADAYSVFEKAGVFDRKSGESFLHNILEQGGARDAMELFVAFRGREPEVDALLRHNGILTPEPQRDQVSD